MLGKAMEASNFLKAIRHEGRLLILCHLVTGEKSLTAELEELFSARQAAVSQHLSRLRLEGLARRARHRAAGARSPWPEHPVTGEAAQENARPGLTAR